MFGIIDGTNKEASCVEGRQCYPYMWCTVHNDTT